MSLQFIVISISEEKRKVLMEQMEELQLEKYGRIHFINAATLENTTEFFENTDFSFIRKRNICCSRSHLFALEFACLTSSTDFSIILEDDIAIHKTQFMNTIRECIQRWDEITEGRRILSLGYVPIAKDRNWYECIQDKKLACLHGSNIRTVLISGLQAYMIRKADFKPFLRQLLTRTYLEYENNMNQLQQMLKRPNINATATDATLNVLFGQTIIYPPLCIERPTLSALGHDNWNKYWHPFFQPRKYQLSDYLTFDEELILKLYPNEDTKE